MSSRTERCGLISGAQRRAAAAAESMAAAQRRAALPEAVRALFTETLILTVDELIERGDSSGERQSAWDEMKVVFLNAGVASRRKVRPEFVAIDPTNRNKTGATGGNAQRHGDKILRMGFSLDKCKDAVSINAPEDPSAIVRENRVFEAMSGGLIPPLVGAHVIAQGSTHTGVFMRQVNAGVRASVKSLGDENGLLSKSILAANREAFKTALDEGIEYFSLHAACPIVWPTLQRFIHRVLNTEARGIVGEIEIMSGMVIQAEAVGLGGSVDWDEVERDAASSMPTCESYVSTLRAYVQANSGGGALIQDLNEFIHMYEECSQRVLGGEYFEAVLKMKVHDAELGEDIPYVRNATVKANLNGPKVVDNYCRTLVGSNLAVVGRKDKKKEILECERLLEEARAITNELPTVDRIRILGMLDQRVAMHITGKGKLLGPREEYKSVIDIAKVALHLMRRIA